MHVSIIIPVYNALSLTQQCVTSIYEHGSTLLFEVILVNNGSAAEVEQWLSVEQRLRNNLRYLHYADPLGFARAANLGVAEAVGEVVILLNSDTLVTPAWMEGLYGALRADPSLGAVTPVTNNTGEPAQIDFSTIDLSSTKALAKVAKRSKREAILYLPQRLTFFCVGFRRSVWLDFGGLNEEYEVGNFEDDDLCLRLRVSGYRLGVAQHVFVYHHNNGTFSDNGLHHDQWMSKNMAIFAGHARQSAESNEEALTIARKWPKRPCHDISVIVIPGESAMTERTLRSLANQTIVDFELIHAASGIKPSRLWIAYVAEGDILYPFHLETLFDALLRNGSESIFADAWVRNTNRPFSQLDKVKGTRSVPVRLSGWMHHASLDPDLLWIDTVPMHWPRLTWETPEQSEITRLALHNVEKTRPNFVNLLRKLYRRLLPLESRYWLDQKIRSILRVPLPDPMPMQSVAVELNQLIASQDTKMFACEGELCAVFMFNAISWDSVTQRQQHFARGLAERGHPVFWIEPTFSPPRNIWTGRALTQVTPNVYLVHLPAKARNVYEIVWESSTVDAMTSFLRLVASAYGVSDAVLFVNYPRWYPLVTSVRKRCGWRVASDCLDDQRALAEVYQTVLSNFEDRLESEADVLLTSSVLMQQRLKPRDSILLQNAADFELFSSATPVGYLKNLPRPIVGFFGVLADWIDIDLVRSAAERFPEWSFVYIGPYTFSRSSVEIDWLSKSNLSNIHIFPQMEPRKLAAHLVEFDICTMPFRDVEVTQSMNPVKLYEYLAAGKPCVSRDLHEVRHLIEEGGAKDLIYLYRTAEEFYNSLQVALEHDSSRRRDQRKAFARLNNWAERVDKLSILLCDLAKTPNS